MITWSDFEKIDIRVATIISAAPFPNARRLAYQLKVDFGELGIKKSSARVTSLYSIDALNGKQVIAVVNFPKKQIAHYFSEVLVLGVIGKEDEITLLTTERPTENGLKIG